MQKPTYNAYEDLYYLRNLDFIVGIDEVGRGCLAGPVCVCGIICYRGSEFYSGVKDSKKLSKAKRKKIYNSLAESKFSNSIVVFRNNNEIDRYGISRCIEDCIEEVLKKLNTFIGSDQKTGVILIDGIFKKQFSSKFEIKQIIKGDDKCYSIGLASIIAKVSRDNLMQEISLKFPNYDFEKNMGYGTKKHIDAIREFGICDIHRKSFEPIKSIILNPISGA